MKTTIFIDTTNNKELSVGIEVDGEKEMIQQEATRARAQVVLPLLEDLLAKHSLTFSDVEKIDVAVGPGSFTGIRVGVAIANTLATLLNVPINDFELGELAEPQYT